MFASSWFYYKNEISQKWVQWGRDVPCGRTDGQTDMTQLIVALCNFSTAPTKVEQYFMTIIYYTLAEPRVTADSSNRNFKFARTIFVSSQLGTSFVTTVTPTIY